MGSTGGRSGPEQHEDTSPDVCTQPALTRWGGEFADPPLELSFRAALCHETYRHARLVLIATVVFNTLFLASDWRFSGTPHIWVALPARICVIIFAGFCLFRLPRAQGDAGICRLMATWMGVNAVAVAALVTSGSDIALFVVLMLPAFYYLAVPSTFKTSVVAGAATGFLLLAAYHSAGSTTTLGLLLGLLMLNAALILVASRSNRLQRLGWLAIRRERDTRSALEASRQALATMFEGSPIPLVLTARRDGRVLRMNDQARLFLKAEIAPGSTLQPFYADPEERDRMLALFDREDGLEEREVEIRRADGERRTVIAKATPMAVEGVDCIMIGVIDITERKQVEARLERLATTDSLTGLPNRAHFFVTARVEMQRAARSGAPLSLLMLDLDCFKQINDRHGHSAGDAVLRAFSRACRTILRKKDLIARLGGEEFAILLPNTDASRGCQVAEAIREAVERLSADLGLPDRVTVSVGLASVRPEEADLGPALARADRALYAAKHNGRNRVEIDEGLVPPVQRIAVL